MEMIVYEKFVDNVNRISSLSYSDFFIGGLPHPNFKKVNYNYKSIDDCTISIVTNKIFWYAIFSNGLKYRTISIQSITNTKFLLILLLQPNIDDELLDEVEVI